VEKVRHTNKKIVHLLTGLFLSPIKSFSILAGVFGFLIIILAPPLTGLDEEAHFVRAYGIANGDFRLYDTDKVSIPQSFRKTIGCFQTKTSEPGAMYKFNYANYGVDKRVSYKCALALPLQSGDTELVRTTAAPYSPTSYIPQAIAIVLGKLLNVPIIIMLYMVRLSVLVAYLAMIAYAIKLLPVRKWALAGIALLPTPLMGLTNPGGDYLLFGLIAIVVAIVIRSIYIEKQALAKESNTLMAVLAVAAILMVLPKGIFPGVCILPLVVFYGSLGHRKAKKFAILFVALAVGLCWQKFGINLNLGNVGVALNSPLDFPRVFVETMFNRWTQTDFIYTGDGIDSVTISGSSIGMPALIITIINILFAVYVFVAYPEKPKIQIAKRQVTAFVYTGILCALAVIAGSFAALFIGGSALQTASESIRGVQTRYFYPGFFILAALPFSRIVFVKREDQMAKIVVIGSTICLTATTTVSIIAFHW
jgi:uncharacterized membrane protein